MQEAANHGASIVQADSRLSRKHASRCTAIGGRWNYARAIMAGPAIRLVWSVILGDWADPARARDPHVLLLCGRLSFCAPPYR